MSELDKAIVLVAQVLNLAEILKFKKEVKPLFLKYAEYAEKNMDEQLAKQVVDEEEEKTEEKVEEAK